MHEEFNSTIALPVARLELRLPRRVLNELVQ